MTLLQQFEHDRDAEYASITARMPPVRVSPWNPVITHRRDQERARAIQGHMRAFALSWWRERGYAVKDMDDECFEATPEGE